jgi:hypothetical protein
MKSSWNTSRGSTVRSDKVDILVTRPEVTVDFCLSGESGPAPSAAEGQVVARVVMNPAMVKRLATALTKAVGRHEDLFGSIDEEGLAHGRLLLSLVDDLGVPHGREYSFKMSEGRLLADRFLLTMTKASLGSEYRRRVLDLCTQLRTPREYLEAIEAGIDAAHMLHFGFEGSESGGMHKVYLEFPLRAVREPGQLHASYKWDPLHPERRAAGSYVRHPVLNYLETSRRLRDLLSGCSRQGAFEAADALLRLAMPRLRDTFHFLEVTEEGTPRKSFDVNLYSASLTMGDVRPWLLRMAERYSLSMGEFSARLDAIGSTRFGHLTGGIDREGRDFFTIHFGVQPRRR